MDFSPWLFSRLVVSGGSHIGSRACPTGENVTFFVRWVWLENLAALLPFSVPQARRRARYGPYTHTATQETAQERYSPYLSQVPMATNGGAHKFNKNDINWQVDVFVSSISILGLESLSAFPRTHPLIYAFE